MDNVLKFGIEFDIDGAVEGLDELGEAANGVGDGLAERFGAMGESIASLGGESSRGARAIGGLAAAVSLVSPEAGQALRSVALLTRGLSVLRLGMGPLAVAIGVVTGALALYQKQQAEKQAQQEQEEAITKALVTVNDRLMTSYEKLAVAAGKISEEEYKILEARRAAFTESLPEVQALTKAIVAQRFKLEEARNSLDELDPRMQNFAALQQLAERGYQDEANAMTALEEKRTTMLGQIRQLTANNIAAIKVENDRKEGIKALAEEERKRQEKAREVAEMQRTIAEIEASALDEVRTETEKAIALYDERIAKLTEIEQKTLGAANTAAAEAAAEAAYVAEMERIKTESLARIQAREEQAHQARLQQLEQERQARISVMNEAGSLFGGLSAIAATAARAQAETDRKAAEQALEVSKKLAVAEATASLASGTMNAAARYAGRPIATGIAITALLAQYGAQLGAIKATKLHQGGLGLMPDERIRGQHVVLEPERTLSPEGTRNLGEEGARRLERGQPLSIVPVPFPVYEHFGKFSQDELLRDSPTSRAIARGPTTGQVSY